MLPTLRISVILRNSVSRVSHCQRFSIVFDDRHFVSQFITYCALRVMRNELILPAVRKFRFGVLGYYASSRFLFFFVYYNIPWLRIAFDILSLTTFTKCIVAYSSTLDVEEGRGRRTLPDNADALAKRAVDFLIKKISPTPHIFIGRLTS